MSLSVCVRSHAVMNKANAKTFGTEVLKSALGTNRRDFFKFLSGYKKMILRDFFWSFTLGILFHYSQLCF